MFQLVGSVLVPLGPPITVAVVLPAGHSITDVENRSVLTHASGDPSLAVSLGQEPAVASEIHADTDDASAVRAKSQLDKKSVTVSVTPVEIEEVSEGSSTLNSVTGLKSSKRIGQKRSRIVGPNSKKQRSTSQRNKHNPKRPSLSSSLLESKPESPTHLHLVDRGVLKVEDQSVSSAKILKSPEGVKRRRSRTVVMRKGKRRGGDEGFESGNTVKETSLSPPSQSLMQSADSSDRIVLKAEDQRHSATPAGFPLSAPKRKRRLSLESYTNGPVQCETCRKHFRCMAALRMHTKSVHLTIASIKCDRCEKIFKRGQGLRNHMKKHLNERSDPCQQCGKTFSTDQYLKRHVLLVHEGGRPVCKAKLPKPSSLQSHMANIHQDYRYTTCKICKQPFATNSELRLHVCISHQGTADTKCWVCKRIFDSLEVLRALVGDSHAGSRTDRVCKICGKEFYMKYYVKKHVRAVHQPQVKDKFCTICGKGFTRGSHLNAHVATIHEGWRTGPCDVCGKTFYKYSELREHFLAKHSGKPIPPYFFLFYSLMKGVSVWDLFSVSVFQIFDFLLRGT
ncbi:unnamed protein product [Calicophoron daubneyi]|uniref:C2H2-type domain-containing protein n=1 Tax=Calicophoron daubneyi TaxID=300641 RepID=A0AAV2SZH2_CALDB